MITNKTFTIIKPDAIANGHIGAIIEKITSAGFKIIALKMTRNSIADVHSFYNEHIGKPFFEELVKFMVSGPIVVAILEKENAVEDFRVLIGATNPAEAAEGTIRKIFATSLGQNAVHGSDSNQSALKEGSFYFPGRETF